MSPEVGRAAFGIAIFIIVVALGLLLVLPKGTPEFAITVVSLLIGLAFLGLVVVMVRVIGR
uniref:Uncharacterized protein n=1 Tax=Thermorudis peleae TaxID=1382356 RepID=A0A831TFB1_9BACT